MFVVGSQAILHVQELIDKAARSGCSVLIIGESGVGTDVASHEIHARSKRGGRFLAVNCAAIPGDLIESELFGHERGASTSASARRLGIFEQANGGTVFLDEITEMKPELQPKLLRVLEDHKIRRVGREESIPVNIRVIAATNGPLHEALEDSTDCCSSACKLCRPNCPMRSERRLTRLRSSVLAYGSEETRFQWVVTESL